MTDLIISGTKGEVFAMALRDQINAGATQLRPAARTALSKISKGIKKGEPYVELTSSEAEQVLTAMGYYLEDELFWAPVDEARKSRSGYKIPSRPIHNRRIGYPKET